MKIRTDKEKLFSAKVDSDLLLQFHLVSKAIGVHVKDAAAEAMRLWLETKPKVQIK